MIEREIERERERGRGGGSLRAEANPAFTDPPIFFSHTPATHLNLSCLCSFLPCLFFCLVCLVCLCMSLSQCRSPVCPCECLTLLFCLSLSLFVSLCLSVYLSVCVRVSVRPSAPPPPPLSLSRNHRPPPPPPPHLSTSFPNCQRRHTSVRGMLPVRHNHCPFGKAGNLWP